MAQTIDYVPRLSGEFLHEQARSFLRKHGIWGQIPVPIDEIVEIDLGMELIPIPNLREVCDLCEVDAFLSSDLKTITLDENLMARNQENRYRFSLAHEIAHMLLHASVLQAQEIRSIEEYRAFRASISDIVYSRLEWQANFLAGAILVPKPALEERFAAVERVVTEQGFRLKKLQPEALFYVADQLKDQFKVSQEVLEIRIRNDRLFS